METDELVEWTRSNHIGLYQWKRKAGGEVREMQGQKQQRISEAAEGLNLLLLALKTRGREPPVKTGEQARNGHQVTAGKETGNLQPQGTEFC